MNTILVVLIIAAVAIPLVVVEIAAAVRVHKFMQEFDAEIASDARYREEFEDKWFNS